MDWSKVQRTYLVNKDKGCEVLDFCVDETGHVPEKFKQNYCSDIGGIRGCSANHRAKLSYIPSNV